MVDLYTNPGREGNDWLAVRLGCVNNGGTYMEKLYLLFDVGGTLLYPDPPLVAQVCDAYGYDIAPSKYLESLFETLFHYDSALRDHSFPEWANDLLSESVRRAGVPQDRAEAIMKEAMERKSPQGLWAYTTSRVRTALERLRTGGFRMAAISNSDGTVAEQLRDAGLDEYFEKIFDSGILGVEKPDPQIFIIALRDLGLEPDQCLYIGDVFMWDVLGANRAGIRAVHIDNLGLYGDWPGVHFPHIDELATALIEGNLALDDPQLLCCVDFEGHQVEED